MGVRETRDGFVIDGVEIKPSELYFVLEGPWSNKTIVAYDKDTATAIALLHRRSIPMRSGWVEHGGAYYSPFDTDGKRIRGQSIEIMKGSELVEKLAMAPENRIPVVEPVDSSRETALSDS